MDGGAETRVLSKTASLDGLRGVAVLLVVAFHASPLFIPAIKRTPLPGGFLGVDLFFVLSGFLITTLLLNEQSRIGRNRLGAFWRRRALRLLPALFALVIVHVIYAYLTDLDMGQEWSKVRYIVTYTQNWRHRLDGGDGLGHLWSLAVEEQFYIVWPLVTALVLTARRRLSFVVTTLAIAIAIVAIHRTSLWHDGESWLWLIMRTDTRADSLLAGALVAHLWTRGITVPRRYLGPATWLAAGFLTWCFLRVRTGSFLFSGGFTLVAIAAAIVILGTVERAWAGTALLESTPLRAVGRVSYGLYLWHFPVFAVVGRYGSTWSPAERVAVAFPVTAALTVASWLLVERHFLRWKDSLEARRRHERKVVAPALAAAD